MTSYFWNPNFIRDFCADIVLQSIITLSAKFSSIEILLHYFFVPSTNSCLCLLWSE